ncbi:uncharacterized protein LMH87_008727 [Akanthomyces muscarius]|uniref:Uncharacterized protein n=1 Tax=Akanthomyces muscarius TaxID=2231603 RepID=A0A9W8QGX4_AKAMU|nr:uncharacterized protein LMH87_008727 [Akanthomyces muscarius]KAJ4158191.1 hypothetical protein LMH87_008727 [Akanthomyces muscarius]
MVLVRSGVRYQRVHAGPGPGWIRNNLDLHAIAILLVVECKRNAAHWNNSPATLTFQRCPHSRTLCLRLFSLADGRSRLPWHLLSADGNDDVPCDVRNEIGSVTSTLGSAHMAEPYDDVSVLFADGDLCSLGISSTTSVEDEAPLQAVVIGCLLALCF